MEKFTKTNSERLVKSSSGAQIAQLGHLNKLVDDLNSTPRLQVLTGTITKSQFNNILLNPILIKPFNGELIQPISFTITIPTITAYATLNGALALSTEYQFLNSEAFLVIVNPFITPPFPATPPLVYIMTYVSVGAMPYSTMYTLGEPSKNNISLYCTDDIDVDCGDATWKMVYFIL